MIIRYVHELEAGYGSDNIMTKRQLFYKILEEEKQNYDVSPHFEFKYETAISRIRRKRFAATGNESPLKFIEPTIIQLVLCMAKLKRALTSSDGLRIVNELIDGTEAQQRLIEWKSFKKMNHNITEDFGRVGKTYWKLFLERHKDELRSKRGRKYASDRSNYTSYLNFLDMFDHIESVLCEDSKIAVRLPGPVWFNKEGDVVRKEEDSFGCKVEVFLKRPDMALVFDEVGCNLSQETDKYNGGEKHLCAPEDEPYHTVSSRHHHFTCMGLTRLDGEPLMCVVIIAGKKRDVMIQTGIE